MCVDFRNLNALTKKDAFPLPRLDHLLHKSAHATIFSKLDLASGFHQIEVHPPHCELTAFILPETIDGPFFIGVACHAFRPSECPTYVSTCYDRGLAWMRRFRSSVY